MDWSDPTACEKRSNDIVSPPNDAAITNSSSADEPEHSFTIINDFDWTKSDQREGENSIENSPLHSETDIPVVLSSDIGDVVVTSHDTNHDRDPLFSSSRQEGVSLSSKHSIIDGSLQRRRYFVRSDIKPNKSGIMKTVSYEYYDNELWNERKRSFQKQTSNGRKCFDGPLHQQKCNRLRRVIIFGIGIVAAISTFFVVWLAHHLTSWSVSLLSPDGVNADMSLQVYSRYLGFSLLFSLLAVAPVALLRPVAAGSGIAEAKAVLNGIKIPYCTEIISAACKAVSLVFAVPSSIPVGVEGPLIFIGMAIGENACRILPSTIAELKSWRARRDFAAIGTAAGVTAAFLSPIGGILFAVEEGASWITSKLITRCFGAAVTVVVLDYLISILDNEGFKSLNHSQPFALSLARFNGLPSQKEDSSRMYPSFGFYDYFVIAAVGLFGGIMGALFVEASKYLSLIRRKHVSTVERKMIEIIFISILACTTLAWIPKIKWMSDCKALNERDKKYFVQLNCDKNEYNDLATLLRQPLPVAINLLYWEDSSAFSPKACVISGFVILILLTISFGASISMGIFIPLLFVGAAFGRSFALSSPEVFDVRTYAIIGSAASLNGVVRVLASVTVIIMETTNQATFVSPLMIACLISRWIGNRLFRKQGIYDEILKLRQIPFLEASAPESTHSRVLRARDIMSRDFAQVESFMRVSDVISTLQNHDQLDFLICDTEGNLLGSISRETLVAVLWNKNAWIQTDCGSAGNEPCENANDSQTKWTYCDFQFDRLDDMSNAEILKRFEEDADCKKSFLDIAHFMSLSPITFAANGSAERAYELFRMNGLRQLIIVDEDRAKVVGIVTRLTLKALEEKDLDAPDALRETRESMVETATMRITRNNTHLAIS
eukprot:CCRYP_005129-RA/>CCRYP_005129-RA protein AED:0.01 eAED:0.01 QI:164/1/1/1/1/1/2/303/890